MKQWLLPLGLASGLVFAPGANVTAQEIFGLITLPLVIWQFWRIDRPLLAFIIAAMICPVVAGGFWFFALKNDYVATVYGNGLRFDPSVAFFVVSVYLILLAGVAKLSFDLSLERQRYSLRLYVFTASGVAFYTFYSLIGVHIVGLPDLIPGFVDGRNFQPGNNIRQSGLSDEPGDLTFLLGSAFLMLFILRERLTHSRRARVFLLTAIVLSIFLASSTLALMVPAAYAASGLFVAERVKKRGLITGGSIFALIGLLVVFLGSYLRLDYVFLDKFHQLFAYSADVNRSASTRGYHWAMAIRAIIDNPWGIGAGNSVFVVDQYNFLNVPFVEGAYSGAKNALLQWVLEGGVVVIPILGYAMWGIAKEAAKTSKVGDKRSARLLLSQIFLVLLCLNALPSFYKLWVWLPLISTYSYCRKTRLYCSDLY